MSRAWNSRRSRHIGRLTAAFVFFWGAAASATATAPVVKAPDLVWHAVMAPDGLRRPASPTDPATTVIIDSGRSTPSPTRPVVPVPVTPVIVVPRTAPTVRTTGHSLRGPASWYCCTKGHPSGLYAAAGPALRVGNWRGRQVHIAGISQPVTLIDWCGCPGGRLIDLYPDAFRLVAPLSRGVTMVTIRW